MQALVSGAPAIAAMWKVTPGLRWLGALAVLRPVAPVADVMYSAFLRARPSLQSLFVKAGARSDTCESGTCNRSGGPR